MDEKTAELLQRFFDRELDEVQAEEFRELLRRCSDESKKEIAQNFQTEFGMRFLAEKEKRPQGFLPFSPSDKEISSAEKALLASLVAPEALPNDRPDASVKPLVRPKPKFRNAKKSRSKISWTVLSLFIAACFAAFAYKFWTTDAKKKISLLPPVQTLGTVTASAEVETEVHSPLLKSGVKLEAEKVDILAGTLTIELQNRVRLLLEGPATLHLHSSMDVFCTKGRLSVFVPPEAHGFQVKTPNATVKDLGTEFFLDVDDQETNVHVVGGEVAVNRLLETWTPVQAGFGMKVKEDGTSKQFSADRNLYVTPEMMKKRVVESVNRQQSQWTEHVRRLNADPTVIAFLGSDKHRENVSGCRRVAGRLAGKNALEFRNRRDAVRLEIPGEYASMTLVASVRIHRIVKSSNTLLSCQDFGNGKIQWQLDGRGAAQLLIGDDSGNAPQEYRSPQIVSSKCLDVWLCFAVVVDAGQGEVRHYMEGRPVAAIPLSGKRPPLRLGAVEIGNRTLTERVPTDRFFDGAIDEFFIFNRALTDDEIRDLVIR